MGRAHWLLLFGGVLVAWALLFMMSVPSDLRALEGVYGADWIAALCNTTPGTAGLWSTVFMWVLMSGAMMAPTALPAFATYDTLGESAPVRFGVLVWGYLLVWVGFSVIAALAQVGLYEAGLLGTFGQSTSALFSAALLIGAGAYQFSALKDACLSRCRAPLTFFMQHWDEGPFRNGLRLGVDCLGCCWPLMALAWVGGMMNLGFMALAMVLMTLEKLPDLGRFVTRPLGVVLIGLGFWQLLV